MTSKTSAKSEVKKMVWADPAIKADALLDRLAAMGLSATKSSVETHRSDFLNSVAVLRGLGVLRDTTIEAGATQPGEDALSRKIVADLAAANEQEAATIVVAPETDHGALLSMIGSYVGAEDAELDRPEFLRLVAERILDDLGSADAEPEPAPSSDDKPTKKGKRPPSRARRWADAAQRAIDALSDLRDVQQEYEDWFDNTPDNLRSSPLGEKLQAVCDIDLDSAISAVEEAEGADLPLGFGRD